MSEKARLAREKWMRGAMEEHEGALVRYAFTLTGDLSSARDVVQDVFLRLWQADALDISEHLKPWLYQVCRNRALDVLKKENRMLSLESEAPLEPMNEEPPPDHAIMNKEINAELMRLVDALPASQQEVVRLKFQSGLSYREIAEATRLSVSNVGFLLHTAIQTLRQKWSTGKNQTI